MSALDHVDLELLAALSADPRATVVALAERLGLSRNTVQARMSRLEKAGVFLSYERGDPMGDDLAHHEGCLRAFDAFDGEDAGVGVEQVLRVAAGHPHQQIDLT